MKSSRLKDKPEISVVRAVSYARVSSKEQEKEGFSIPAQQKLLQGYAEANRIQVVENYVDIETAKQTGRTNFDGMIRYLKKHEDVRVVLVEKTDRLYRNLKDWVTIDELDVEIHLVKEGIILSRDSKSSEKFVHGIKVLMAKNYIDNLSEEARKGQQEKAEQGIWPTKAPRGYRNVIGPDGKKIIAPDPKTAGVIAHLFGWYASGTMSLKEAAVQAHAAGLGHPSTGKPMPVSNIHAILRNLIYTGDFEWNGRRYKGKHQPLVTRELWERVQGVLDGRNARKLRGSKRDFAFTGLINCGHCGCALVGELKKGRYVYYHCTGFKGKCGEPYVREEVISEKFTAVLGLLTFGEDVLAWVVQALKESHADERREHEEAIKRLRTESDRLQNRLSGMYFDKLDGRITGAFYDQMAETWRNELDSLAYQIKRHESADRSYIDEGVRFVDFARNAQNLFAKQEPQEQRRLLNFLLSNSTWKNGNLTVEFRQPFDLIAGTVLNAKKAEGGKALNSPGHSVWLGDLDSNQD
ncbi:recombinase family protein [Methylocystis sp. MJC1]|uniref:recombinase family protein n=1 Tax=Methylocystis sp. MJC1 TaxID=2654282 RepID=UPI0013ECEFA2|nr:recombinase family protein [Methylocystis sp. MJC1]MBU6527968.1 recombinase family protein [Methylocystis sp. MJC1]UZX10889.1 recombinase family protein [Methylocystis sp. MJC1]